MLIEQIPNKVEVFSSVEWSDVSVLDFLDKSSSRKILTSIDNIVIFRLHVVVQKLG